MERIIFSYNVIGKCSVSAGCRYCEVTPGVVGVRTDLRAACVVDCNNVTLIILLKEVIIKRSCSVSSRTVFKSCGQFIQTVPVLGCRKWDCRVFLPNSPGLFTSSRANFTLTVPSFTLFYQNFITVNIKDNIICKFN